MAIAAAAGAAGSSAASSAAAAGAASAGINAGGRWIGTAITAAFNKRAQKRQQEYTEKNMQKAHEYDLDTMSQQQNYARENWAMENEREDYLLANAKKIEQRAYTDANLNPALAGIGGGYQAAPTMNVASPAGGSSGAPMGAPYTPLNAQMGDLASDYLDAKYKASLIANLDEDTREKKIGNDNEESKNATFASIGDLYGVEIKDSGSFNAANLFNQAAQQYLTKREMEETTEMRRQMAQMYNDDPSLQQQYKQSLIDTYKQIGEVNEQIKAQTGKTLQEILNLKEGVEYTKAQIKEAYSRIDKNTQDVLESIMRTGVYDEQIQLMNTQRQLAANMDYATIIKRADEARESGDAEDAEFWTKVLMYRSHNYENLIPAAIYSAGNALGTALQVIEFFQKGGKPRPAGFTGR